LILLVQGEKKRKRILHVAPFYHFSHETHVATRFFEINKQLRHFSVFPKTNSPLLSFPEEGDNKQHVTEPRCVRELIVTCAQKKKLVWLEGKK
jgi:hypothetical protein